MLGLIVFIGLMIFLFSLGMIVLVFAALLFLTWVVFMVGGVVAAAVIGGEDAQLRFYIGGVISVALLWLGIGHLNNSKKTTEENKS